MNSGGDARQRALILEHEGLVQRIVARYARKYAGLLDRDDIEGIVRLRMIELARVFRVIPSGPPFEGYAWKALCGAVEEAAGLETRQLSKMRRAAFEVPSASDVDLHTDDHVRSPRDRLQGFLEGVAVAGALGFVSEAAANAASPRDDRLVGERLYAALEKLPRRMRRVIELRFIEERTIVAVADTLGISAATVRREQSAGLSALARILRPRDAP